MPYDCVAFFCLEKIFLDAKNEPWFFINISPFQGLGN